MAIIKKSTNNNYWRGCGEEEILLLCWWECKLIQPLWKRVWRFFRKLEIKPPYDPAIPLLGIYPEESEVSEVAQLCPTLCDPMNCRPTRLPRPWDLYWSGLPFPSPRDLPNPGIEPRSPTLWADALLSEPLTRVEKDTCIPLFTAALFTIARTWKQPRCPSTGEWIKKLRCIYTVEYYSAIKRNAFESVLMR